MQINVKFNDVDSDCTLCFSSSLTVDYNALFGVLINKIIFHCNIVFLYDQQ